MKGLLDASVIGTLLFDDEGAMQVAAWIGQTLDQAAISDFAWGECVGAMGVKVRAGLISGAVASRLLDKFSHDVARWSRPAIAPEDVPGATAFVADFALPLRFADAVHIAIARRTGMTLITTDGQQYRAALALGVAASNPLEK